ncbi:hypothetical protein UA08_03619 [Talaromyces atroroseus]|uniref:Uncharacterized protein n=1 Tax=Talaromyces atroroseus TaxID=1441469 RepID=A0A225AK14_TALAT|nr:hypothetical protein UA08_03619 [Talaromyces atroroseus]OKL61210.1 hypothetical protein UA08_03619 [Talaromyces atroroseus]
MPASVAVPSAFSLALENYIQSRPKKSKTPQFLQKLQQQQQQQQVVIDANTISQDLIQLQRDATDSKAASIARKTLKPVVSILSTYSGIVDTLIQVDPMPTAILWGCLRAVIDTSKRFLDLYDKIADQLERLGTHLDILTEYEWLFPDSSTMQKLLQKSYIDIIRFWVRVEKECSRCVANRLTRAVAPFSTTKLDGIISKIGESADAMTRVIPVVQERLRRREAEDVAKERELAGLAREEQADFIQRYEARYAEKLKELEKEQKRQRQRDVQNWIRAGEPPLNVSNFRHHDEKCGERSPSTCQWLFEDGIVKKWVNSQSSASQLWVKGAPGVGKSVLTAYAIEKIPEICNDKPAVVYQYFTFDEEFPTLLVYRSLAEQLINQLGKVADMPEDIHAFTQRGATPSKAGDVKTVISMLVNKLPVSYVFLDGLDEECTQESRRKHLDDILDFFQDLANKTPSRLRLWCCSQTHTCLDNRFESQPSIEVTKSLNSQDIETYLARKITVLNRLPLDTGYKNLILKDLREKSDGCFLWASLMLHSMSKAATLNMVQELIEDGLPGDYEKYYRRKMEDVDPSLRGFVAVLLACIVHARRPLRLDELCECTAMAKGPAGHDIDRNEKLVKDMVLELCQPLVRIHEIQEPDGGKVNVCTLTHGSVKAFLLRNAQILEQDNACALTNDVMADICLKYLLQPRYQQLLTKKNDTFVDLHDDDIMEHHLLPYAAKYWDKHLDDVEFSSEFNQKVTQLVTSSQFFTLLQIQSLLVEGQFRFWYNSFRPWAGRHIRRVFPQWFEDNCDGNWKRDYALFVGEWGELLDEDTSIRGAYEGQIDRCFFRALGSHNFLHLGPSRYKSLAFFSEDSATAEPPIRCFDGVDERGELLMLLKLENLSSEKLELRCERWSLSGQQPKFQGFQTLYASSSSWPLYEYPLSEKIPGRPRLVSFTTDLQFMRIGSQVFSKGEDDEYIPLAAIGSGNEYFEEMASNGHFIAISARRLMSRADIRNLDEADGSKEAVLDYAEIMNKAEELAIQALDQITASASSESSQPSTTATGSSDTDKATSVSSATSFNVEEPEDFVHDSQLEEDKMLDAKSETGQTDEFLHSSSNSISSNTAYTSWSEASSELMSDEMEDEDQWNDQPLTLEELELERREGSLSGDSEGDDDGENANILLLDAEIRSSFSDMDDDEDPNKRDDLKEMYSEADESSGVESHYSSSNYSFSDSNDGSENEDGALFEEMMVNNKTTKADGTRRVTLRIYDSAKLNHQDPVFHYSCYIKARLFDSPPAFHPSKPLLVWPLGDGEILFANYETKTYYTRELCRSQSRSCHVSIKAHFSRDGQYLHFAALEASEAVKEEGSQPHKVLLRLQLSTHRLSIQKTARSPPRLVFRTTVNLGSVSKIPVSNLPYSLTWTDTELFFTIRGRKLDVIRIPLFRSPVGKSSEEVVYYLKDPIFLPRSADVRNTYLFPDLSPATITTQSTSKKKDRKTTLILGSYCSLPNQDFSVPRSMSLPPMAVYLRENNDLEWTRCTTRYNETCTTPKQPVNNACGRLKGKFESFDLKEDCDIVPYLS